VREFIRGLVSVLQTLWAEIECVDRVQILRTIYTFVTTWVPTSGRSNFNLESWGYGWTDSVANNQKMGTLLKNRASLASIRRAHLM
jgi:hypothetical protein